MCPMALISAIMVTTLFEIEHPCDTSKNGLYHRGMIYSLIDLSQCRWQHLVHRKTHFTKKTLHKKIKCRYQLDLYDPALLFA